MSIKSSSLAICLSLLSINMVAAKTAPFKPAQLPSAESYKSSGNKILIGSEGRELADTSQYPYSAIGLITFDDQAGNSYQCTGSMVGKNVVLTNAHCVWDTSSGVFYRNHKFQAGFQVLASKQNAAAQATKLVVAKAYQKGDESIDFAFLVLDKNVGEQTGWLGTTDMKARWYRSDRFYVSGYGTNYTKVPAGITVQSKNTKACRVTRASVTSWFSDLVHDCDTGPGNSGSALFTYIDGKPYAVGVHHGGTSDQSDKRKGCVASAMPGSCENYATRTGEFASALAALLK